VDKHQAINEQTRIRRVCAFLRKKTLWAVLCFMACVFVYGYVWLGLPQNLIRLTDSADIDEDDLPELIEVSDEDYVPTVTSVWRIDEHVSLIPDVSALPDIMQVNHISRLFNLSARKDIVKDEIIPEIQKFKIAIVIDDMGASPKRTDAIIALEAPLTSSFLTFAPQLKKQVKQSRRAGHEIMVHVPMQPHSNVLVSEDVLTVTMSEQQISDRFKKMLDKFEDIKGINNHMGSLFTERADKLAPIMKILAERKLFFLDSKTTPKSQGEKTAALFGVPSAHRHIFLDNENELEYILRQLEKTEKIARRNGYAIAIGHPKTQTAKALEVWLETLADKNIELVPLSVLIMQIESLNQKSSSD